MFKYIVKRILYFIPTLFAISLLAFGLSKCTSGDPCQPPERQNDSKYSFLSYNKEYRERCELFGLSGATFYFGISSRAYPDTLYRIIQKNERENWSTLVAHYGNWENISAYKKAIYTTQLKLFEVPDSVAKSDVKKIRRELSFLPILSKDEAITARLNEVLKIYNNNFTLKKYLKNEVAQLQSTYRSIKENATPSQLYIPKIHWYGWDNQYHRWITKTLKGDFGFSYINLRPVSSEIKDAIFWTFIMMVLSIILSYSVAIPLGVFSAKNKGLRFDKITTLVLFMLYSLPSFWVATMMVVFFTTPEYGEWTNIFPSIGLGNLRTDLPYWDRFWEAAKHLILPVLCLSYARLAFISRQMRGGMLNVLGMDYIRTAKAKGLNKHQVIWKHGFRNSLFPIITLFASVLPMTLAGSVIIEVIFNIPGMGKLTLDAILQNDYPIVFAVLLLSAMMTMIGVLISDILYVFVDPRVSFGKKN
ncbi:MAG TPA: ABC transporter permease [Phaeodactylibacter sp.]|nr:ABC transporter permease [Phaeodactylibacter sp.]